LVWRHVVRGPWEAFAGFVAGGAVWCWFGVYLPDEGYLDAAFAGRDK